MLNGVPPSLPAAYYTQFLSDVAKNRKPSPIRSLFPLEKTPGLLSMLAGKPNPEAFPFTSFSFTAQSPEDNTHEISLTLDGKEVAAGLQYGDTAGYGPLREWLSGLQEFFHGKKRSDDWSLSIGTGSQDLLFKAITALVNPGDSVLVESPVYAGVIPMFHTLHCEQIEIETDAHGIKASSLKSILESWSTTKPKPRILYTVPYGCNPTGMTATDERRKEVLALAREHNFLILEDDPYYYVYYGKAPRPRSYFSLEHEEPVVGRVLRFDSLSKVLSAGIRIGFASGPTVILDEMNKHTATSNLQVSSLTQVIVVKLLKAWGYDGFKIHAAKVSEFYRRKRDVFENAMKKHLSGLAEWVPPEAGMFYWFKLILNDDLTVEGDSKTLLEEKAVESGVLALPGTVFHPNGRKSAYVRTSFSLLNEDDVNEALQRLAKVVRDAHVSA